MARRSETQRTSGWKGRQLFAFGHSTRTLNETVALLQAHGVLLVADVRTVPRSRTNPQFNRDSFPEGLRPAGIGYAHLPKLGGLRKARKDSPNGAWRNASFRGYADHMSTDEFAAGLEELRALAEEGPVAVMCAEAVRWRCHRSLLADALLVRGATVRHIVSERKAEPHALTPFARLEGERVLYPAP